MWIKLINLKLIKLTKRERGVDKLTRLRQIFL